MPKKVRMVICPNCGEEIKADAVACRYCGSDKETGWSESNYLDGTGVPEDLDEDQYNELVEKEFGSSTSTKKKKPLPWLAIVAGVLMILFLIGAITQFF